MHENEYLIWSIEHDAWWRPNHSGYTTSMADAGVYSFEEAVKIVSSANYTLTLPRGTRYEKEHNIPHEAMILITPDINERLA